jgi:transposase
MAIGDTGHYGDGLARRMQRLWTQKVKWSICFQTDAMGASVAQTARRCEYQLSLQMAA